MSTVAAARRQTRRPLVLVALLMAMFMGAIEGTIVATAMPSIAARLGGLALYSWVFSAFLLMQAVTIPIYGKLADLFGRKRVFIAGVLVFLLSSWLCGLAGSMSALVAFRLVQGAGAGAVQPLAVTLIGDLYSIEERSRVQGWTASVWGASSIVGPLVGALIVEHADWAWVFWLNLPFGAVAIALVALHLHERLDPKKPAIDYAGAILLFAGLGALMLVATQGTGFAPETIVALLAFAATAFAGLALVERRVVEPVVHFELWRMPLIALANLATLCGGVAMIGLIGFLPAFVQGVLGGSALQGGFALCAMSIGWPVAAVIAGRRLTRTGVRALARTGGAALFAGGLIVALGSGYGALAAGTGALIMGAGLGFLNTTFIVSIQSRVGWERRGVATASNLLMRILGNALGAAIFGGVLNLALERACAGCTAALSAQTVQALLAGAQAGGALGAGLASGLHAVFWGSALFAAGALAASWRVPEVKAGERSS